MERAAAQPSKRNPARTRASIRTVQLLTIAWMCVELSVSLVSGIRAHSVALTSFAGDSAVELLSAIVVLRRFSLGPGAEKNAARINAALLYVLAAYIVVTSTLSLFYDRFRPEPTFSGIVLLVTAAFVMPLLGRAKRRLAVENQSGALKADAAQSNICAYMSWIALAGLILNAAFHFAWADSIAALLLLPLVISEANEARKGEVCDCH
jgi:divalent metal cation (Fe/Co/Zn/Cd) transporter